MRSVLPLLLLGRQAGASLDESIRPAWVSRSAALLLLVAGLGVAARMFAATRGSNFDMESYWIVANLSDSGQNVYASTPRYNYGPAWFWILDLTKDVADRLPQPQVAFRYLVAASLTVVDLLIAGLLLRRFGPLTAALFFLNPVSVLITGYHSQFDNLAVALALGGALVLDRTSAESRRSEPWQLVVAAGLIGASLVVKHIFLVLPLWLALRHGTLRTRAVLLLLPPLILALSFLPYAADGAGGIASNVIGYRSFNNAPFLNWLIPPILARHLSPFIVLGIALVALGWIWRKRPAVEQILLYTIAVVVFAPAIANQYLAIPAAAVIVFLNLGYLCYLGASALYLVADSDGIGLQWLAAALPDFLVRAQVGDLAYAYLIALLAIGLVITGVELMRMPRQRGVSEDAT